jgi:flagellin
MLNSINTNIAALNAQGNIGRASDSASSSIARLSSGNRIVRASDDVAGLAVGTALKTNVTSLKVALTNAAQGSSLLQVADGALAQISDILQRQKSLAVQAGSGSLSNTERGFLNQEFQNLSLEIDRLVDSTNFNGVKLLDGSISERVAATASTAAADKGAIRLSFSANNTATQTLVINGTTVTGGTEFTVGGTTNQTLTNLAAYLNGATAQQVNNLNSATYSVDGDTLVITARAGGSVGDFNVGVGGTWNSFTSTGGAASSSIKLFAADSTITSTSADASSTAAGAAAIPLKDGEVYKFKIGAGTDNTVVTIPSATTYSLNDLVRDINAQTTTTGIKAAITGYSGAYNVLLSAALPSTGTGANITITANGNVAAPAAGTTVYVANAGFSQTSNTGLSRGDVRATGTAGNNFITDQVQTKSKVTITFPSISTLNDLVGSTITFNDNVAGTDTDTVISFSTNTGLARGANEVTIGATLEETLDNAVATINTAVGNGSFQQAQGRFTAYREGNSIIIESRDVGDVNNYNNTGVIQTTLNGAATTLGLSQSNSGNLSNGTTTGVSTSGVVNKDFIGTISGFSATYVSANRVDASITVGGKIYTAKNFNTNVGSATTVRFLSTDAGFFDVELRANAGSAVSDQAGANGIAQRLDAAFSGLKFYQNRDISSYNGTDAIISDGNVIGSLAGSKFELASANFSGAITIDDIRINAPVGSSANGSVSFVVNGEEYVYEAQIGKQFGANQTYTFTNLSDPQKTLKFTTGSSAIDFSTAQKATDVRTALQNAFGVGDGSAELKFQVGSDTTDTLSVGLSKVTTGALFNGQSLDVLSAATAATAAATIDEAINRVTSVRAEVGSIQSRFNYASANVQSSLQNQDAARGVLLDTDVAAESTLYATAQVQLQAGISVLAQANLLPQNLLKLIG